MGGEPPYVPPDEIVIPDGGSKTMLLMCDPVQRPVLRGDNRTLWTPEVKKSLVCGLNGQYEYTDYPDYATEEILNGVGVLTLIVGTLLVTCRITGSWSMILSIDLNVCELLREKDAEDGDGAEVGMSQGCLYYSSTHGLVLGSSRVLLSPPFAHTFYVVFLVFPSSIRRFVSMSVISSFLTRRGLLTISTLGRHRHVCDVRGSSMRRRTTRPVRTQ
jgi:hypothetical protein